MRKLVSLSILSLACSSALAGKQVPMPPPKPEPVPLVQPQVQAQLQLQQQQQNQQQQLESNSSQVLQVEAPSNIQASPEVSFRSRMLALSLPGMPGAPAVGGHSCMEHTPITQVFGAGRGGRTVLNPACMAFVQCMDVARMYMELGEKQLALRQLSLEECGGVHFEVEQALPAEPLTSEEQHVEACEVRQERIFEACQTKGK